MPHSVDFSSSNADLSSVTRKRSPVSRVWLSERRLLLFIGDLVLLGSSLGLALWLRHEALGMELPIGLYPHWWLALWALWIIFSVISDCYDLERASDPVASALLAAAIVFGVCSLYLILPVISAPLTRSRMAWFYFVGIAILSVGAWRVVYALLLRQPAFIRRVLIVGAGRAGRSLGETLGEIGAHSGIVLVGWIDDDERLQGQHIYGLSVLGDSKVLCDVAAALDVDEIVVAITDPTAICGELMRALMRCWERGLTIVPMALYYEEITGAVPIQHLGQNMFALVGYRPSLVWLWWGAVRRVIDLLAALAGLAMMAPLVPIIALAIYLDCPGPIFYRQDRVGRAGYNIRICKFRSMIPNAEREGVQWAKADDERITRVGRFLRKTRIDELPQLWNLLKGDMTLIGPRPERPEFVEELRQQLPYYSIRHSIKPGLTGWAQVKYPYGNSYHDSMMKLQYDLYYVKHRGPVLDLTIILRTVRVVLQMHGT